MQCDIYHPFQILADLMTIVEKVGDPRGKTINVSWAYASSYQKPISVPQSLVLQMTRFGMNVRLTHPPEYKLMPDIVQQAEDNVAQHGGSFEILDDFDAGFKGADILYPKSWGALLTTDDDEESARIGTPVRRLDHRRPPHGPGQRECPVHALSAGGPQHRSHRRGHRRAPVDRLR